MFSDDEQQTACKVRRKNESRLDFHFKARGITKVGQ